MYSIKNGFRHQKNLAKIGEFPLFQPFGSGQFVHGETSPRSVQASGQNSSGGAGGAVGRRKWRLGGSTVGIATQQ